MSETAELKKAWEDTKTVWENEFKKAALTAADEKKSFGQELGLTKEKLVRMEEVIAKYDLKWEEKRAKEAAMEAKAAALEAAILDLKKPGAGKDSTVPSKWEGLEHFFSEKKAFGQYFRKGQQMAGYYEAMEKKALATDADTAGGFLVPTDMASRIIELNVLYSPIRQVCTVENLSMGDTLEIPKEGSTAFSVQKIGERAARPETTSGTFAMTRIPTHEFYSNPWATRKMLDDSAFNVEQWIAKKVGEQKGKDEGAKLLTGTGVGEPQGIDLGGSSEINVTTSDAFTAAKLISFQYALEEPYASQAVWLSKRANFGQIRQLTATTGDFLWQPGLSAGEPPLLLNRPIVACNDVALLDGSSTSATKVIYFGDFKSGYTIVDRLGMRMIRDEMTNKPHIEFYHFWRYGGQVVLPEAIKIGVAS